MRTKIIIIMVMLVVLPLISGENFGTYREGDCVNLVMTCDNCTYVNISRIISPINSTVLLSDVAMTKDDTVYNYTFCNANTSGQYNVYSFGDDDGTVTTSEDYFIINPQGIIASESRTQSVTIAIYFLASIGIILFLGFIFTNKVKPVKWTLFIFAIIFLLASLNILSISLADEVVNPNLETFFDNFTAIAFYFYWFAAGLLGIMWIFTFFNTWIYKKNLNNARKYGIG